jgi:DNA-binding transcriptional regulator YhcF (GntR family)
MSNTINGAFIISRSLYDSEIWVMKPSEWLKIWIYLLWKVNWQDNWLFKRGEQLFKYDYITRDCRVSYDTVRRCIEHLEKANQISTRRTTRGLIITVNNYSQYQDFDNYSQSKANQKPIKSQSSTHSIIEEGNKGIKKEDTNTISIEWLDKISHTELKSTIVDWMEYKKERKEKFKPRWLKSFITQCTTYTPESVIEAMQRSMANSYQWVIWDNCIKIPKFNSKYDFSTMADKNEILNIVKNDRSLLPQLEYQNKWAYDTLIYFFNVAKEYGC